MKARKGHVCFCSKFYSQYLAQPLGCVCVCVHTTTYIYVCNIYICMCIVYIYRYFQAQYIFRHTSFYWTLLYCTLYILHFYTLTFCGNTVPSKAIRVLFQQHFLTSCPMSHFRDYSSVSNFSIVFVFIVLIYDQWFLILLLWLTKGLNTG